VITTVTEADLDDLLPLMRAYCEFYEVGPSDEALLALSRNLIEHPGEGLQLIARGDDASRLGVMNDLFVSEAARGGGHADALIAECAARCRERGATDLAWQTARTNGRAQAVYDRVGAERDDRWLDYSLTVEPGATTPDS
jgi:GNAT superfamily N-acetyltransferase